MTLKAAALIAAGPIGIIADAWITGYLLAGIDMQDWRFLPSAFTAGVIGIGFALVWAAGMSDWSTPKLKED